MLVICIVPSIRVKIFNKLSINLSNMFDESQTWFSSKAFELLWEKVVFEAKTHINIGRRRKNVWRNQIIKIKFGLER